MLTENKTGMLTTYFLTDKPAIYGKVLNGSDKNFFNLSDNCSQLMQELITLCKR